MRLVTIRRLAGAGTGLVLRASATQVGLALVYHQVTAEPRPGREIVATAGTEQFEAHLRHLARWYRVVPAGSLGAAVRGRRRWERLPVAITFDDDSVSHVTQVLPRLQAHGLQATFFLCGASLDAPFAFWWERLQRGVDAGARPMAEAMAMTAEIEAMSPTDRRAAAAELGEQVRALAAAGQEIGFHTRDHHPLPQLDDDELAEALTVGRAELETVVANPLRTLAYPHGLSDDRVRVAARSGGYASCFTTEAEAIVPSTDPMRMGRADPTRWSKALFGYTVSRTMWKGRRSGRR
jgi:peptidoglycan/xylan/chitin deacetylase (PgdA/CDA1 family)